ncbi:calcium-binding protein, partial [Cellvibrio mixtus]|uniref:calcium-binding protein n=1 Tax=Cellvibrio mixtus TaxID=39650 RepID=UPI0005878FB5
ALRRVGNDLFIDYGVGDSIKVQDFYYSNSYRFTHIEFPNNVVYTVDEFITAMPFQYGDGNDSVTLSSASEIARGGGGNDTINAGAGNDVVYGEAGDDSLLGGDGNDVLDGGVGNDYLNGGAGNDVFVFRKGSGIDRVYAYDTTANRIDTIRFADVNSADIKALRRVGYDLIIDYGVGDSISVQDYFYSNAYQFNKVEFANGISYTATEFITAMPFQYGNGDDVITLTSAAEIVLGGGGNDVINAGGGNDKLYGEAGNDSLSGGDGNDLLDGGVGNDTLNGGAGNDVFVFRKGSGNDTVFAYDTSVDRVDTIRFEDVNPSDVSALRRVGNDL